MMRDRSDGDALLITQSLLAEMLGVQRPTITNAFRELEASGLIEPGRRQVTILDRNIRRPRIRKQYSCVVESYERFIRLATQSTFAGAALPQSQAAYAGARTDSRDEMLCKIAHIKRPADCAAQQHQPR
jgi:DNA-binding transcriptional regulator YhcF (GntR family)